MQNWIEYIDSIDDSHQMTTDKNHIKYLCEIIVNKSYNVLELGSYLGISTAGLALSSPESKIYSVDLSDHIPEQYRKMYWDSLGIKNISAFSCSSSEFLMKNDKHYDFIFHDTIHGSQAMNEYLHCVHICDILAIHDFEQISDCEQQKIITNFNSHIINLDKKNRALFIGWKR